MKTCKIKADADVLMGTEAIGYGDTGEHAPKVRIFDELEVDQAATKIKHK